MACAGSKIEGFGFGVLGFGAVGVKLASDVLGKGFWLMASGGAA